MPGGRSDKVRVSKAGTSRLSNCAGVVVGDASSAPTVTSVADVSPDVLDVDSEAVAAPGVPFFLPSVPEAGNNDAGECRAWWLGCCLYPWQTSRRRAQVPHEGRISSHLTFARRQSMQPLRERRVGGIKGGI